MTLDDSTRQRIEEIIGSDRVVLFMKGNREAPQCGFSATVVQILDRLVPEYTTVDLRLGYPLRGMQLYAEARNVLDRKYDASGFLDPSGSGEAYYYPAVGRVISVGVRAGW